MYLRAMMFLGVLGVSLSLVLGALSLVTWEIAAVLIAVSLGIPSLEHTYEKLTCEVSPSPEGARKAQKQNLVVEENDVLREETIRVSPADVGYYEFQLKRYEVLRGEIRSDSPVDIYFVDSANFRKWDKNRTFDYEDCNESVLETKIDYLVPKGGTWFLIIENNGRKSATVKVQLYLGSSETSD